LEGGVVVCTWQGSFVDSEGIEVLDEGVEVHCGGLLSEDSNAIWQREVPEIGLRASLSLI
jgi:hypothetical protein